jgi:pimeloyl-ACP methyl ester carboxylesterase
MKTLKEENLVRYDNQGFEQLEFTFLGKKAIVILPKEENRNGRAIFKTEYFGAFPVLQLEFVRQGYTFLFLENRNRWGTESELIDQERFLHFAFEEFDLEPGVITIGMSCGGMISILLAAKYPELIRGLYLDAPVMNFLSCPGGFGNAPETTEAMWQEFEKAHGMTKRELLLYRKHPIDKLDALIAARKPIYLAYGTADLCVPFEENAIELVRRYEETEIPFVVEAKEGCGHHPHGPQDPAKVIEFFEQFFS